MPVNVSATVSRPTEKARAALVERMGRIPGLELRVVESAGESEGDGTRLFNALGAALSDVPPERVAGAVLVTDGRVHDVPAQQLLGFAAPVHSLITGREGERDRRVVLTATPRFGIVGQRQTVGYRVEDEGAPRGARVAVVVRRDGEIVARPNVVAGTPAEVQIEITHAGANIIEIEASPLEGELTPLNNRAALNIDGVREKLRVLLVSGEPHSGERTWRNLLKSDANVDLIHFTILRPPEKQDGTPIQELSLIAFPTRELFQQRIKDFHLIIFDRYAQQGVLPLIYFDNIVRYVREGGAVLVAAGAEFAGPNSILPLSARSSAAGATDWQHRGGCLPGEADGTRQAASRNPRASGGRNRSAALEQLVPGDQRSCRRREHDGHERAGGCARSRPRPRERRPCRFAAFGSDLAVGAQL